MTDDRDLVSKKLAKSIYTLSPRRKGRSLIWSILTEIINEEGDVLEGYLYCRTCLNVIKYLAKQTSNLTRHKCCQLLKETKYLKNVTTEDKRAALETSLVWLREDCQPFSVISGSGFQTLAKFFINIGAQYGGHVNLDDLLPDEITLSRSMQELAKGKKQQIKNEIADIVNSGGLSTTIDMWTDNYVRRNFLRISLHYQKNLKLYDIVLGVKSMDFQHSTDDNITSKLSSLFSEFGINDMEKLKYVTDEESSVSKALEKNIHLNCSSHLFAKVLQQSFEETDKVVKLVETCKIIIKYMKKSQLQHQLIGNLKSGCPGRRWNWTLTMFKLIVDNWLQIEEMLEEKEETQGLLLISISNLKVVKDIIELCSAFEIIFKKLQLYSSPSLCFVIPSIEKVKKLCAAKCTDLAPVMTLKENIIKNVDKIWTANLSLWQKAAFFLYPPALHMQQTDLIAIKNFCINLIETDTNKIIFTTAAGLAAADSNPASPSSPNPDDKELLTEIRRPSIDLDGESSNQSPSRKDVEFFFSDLFEYRTIQTTKKSPGEEIERYCRELVDISNDFNVLKWWKSNEKYYPYLSRLALQIHSIPASSVFPERDFLSAGNVITENKNRLGPKSIDSLVFLHSYFKNFQN